MEMTVIIYSNMVSVICLDACTATLWAAYILARSFPLPYYVPADSFLGIKYHIPLDNNAYLKICFLI